MGNKYKEKIKIQHKKSQIYQDINSIMLINLLLKMQIICNTSQPTDFTPTLSHRKQNYPLHFPHKNRKSHNILSGTQKFNRNETSLHVVAI